MAERTGLEPATPSVTGWYSKPTELPLRILVGGCCRDRTYDLWLVRPSLSRTELNTLPYFLSQSPGCKPSFRPLQCPLVRLQLIIHLDARLYELSTRRRKRDWQIRRRSLIFCNLLIWATPNSGPYSNVTGRQRYP